MKELSFGTWLWYTGLLNWSFYIFKYNETTNKLRSDRFQFLCNQNTGVLLFQYISNINVLECLTIHIYASYSIMFEMFIKYWSFPQLTINERIERLTKDTLIPGLKSTLNLRGKTKQWNPIPFRPPHSRRDLNQTTTGTRAGTRTWQNNRSNGRKYSSARAF